LIFQVDYTTSNLIFFNSMNLFIARLTTACKCILFFYRLCMHIIFIW